MGSLPRGCRGAQGSTALRSSGESIPATGSATLPVWIPPRRTAARPYPTTSAAPRAGADPPSGLPELRAVWPRLPPLPRAVWPLHARVRGLPARGVVRPGVSYDHRRRAQSTTLASLGPATPRAADCASESTISFTAWPSWPRTRE